MRLVTGGIVVTEAGSARADIAIDGERIATIGTDLAEAFAGAETILDASGMHVFPGFFDAHVHFCDQRLSHWEDFTTAGRAAVAGGVTTVMDMPLNDPVTSTAVAFENRLQAVGANAITDFALWGGCVPGNAAELEPMQSLGARAFKAFMREVDGYPWCDSDAVLDGMREAARLDVPFGVHAESDPLIKARTAAMRAAGRNDAKAHMWAHSPFTEHEAISRAIALAREAGCRLHVMHVSAPDALPEIAAADHVVGEAQIGFMTMDAADYVRHGAWARFSPPLRERVDVERLWEALACGTLEYVISDHSGYPPEMKEVETIWEAADGVPAVQTCYPLLLSEGFHARQAISLEQFVTLSSATAARLYGLYPRKGALLPGVSDADLAIVDIDAEWTLETSDLHYKHPWTPQAGTEITGRVVATIRRGELVYSDGTVHAKPGSGAPV